MAENPFTSVDEPPRSTNRPKSKEGWRWTLGGVLVLIGVIPALVLLVFYYREVAVTYYMTRNPLQPSSLHMARTIESVLIGNMRDLASAADRIHWTGSHPPSSDQIRTTIGKSMEAGELTNYAGLAVIDHSGNVIARFDRRDIDPYLDQARHLAEAIYSTGGLTQFLPLVVSGHSPKVILMVAVRTTTNKDGSGGVLTGLINLQSLLKNAIPIPRIRGTPGHSYLLSGDGLVLLSSDPQMVGKNFLSTGRKGVIERFSAGHSGAFSSSVDGTPYLYGSTLLGNLIGIVPSPWLAVLEAPKHAIDREVARTRLNMNLIVFLLVPAFMMLIIFILYKSFRSS